MGTFMLFTHIILPEAICCCVETCNVYVMLSTYYVYILSWALVLTSTSYRYIWLIYKFIA